MNRFFLNSLASLVFVTLSMTIVSDCQAQKPGKKDSGVTIKGSVFFDKSTTKAWNGDDLSLDPAEIETRLREYVTLPPPPYPAGHEKWTAKQRVDWQVEFAKTAEGKKIIERNQKLLEAANSFEIKIEDDGSFVVYDVPAGEYAIQGRIAKEINQVNYSFEVFGKLDVDDKVDVMDLAPIRIEITPQYQRGQKAPPLNVTNYNDKEPLKLDLFEGKYLMLNFWSAKSPAAADEQKAVQALIKKFDGEFKFSLLSVNVDKERKDALKLLQSKKLLQGSHGFTLGFDHEALRHYGVRDIPSYWLIDTSGNILMNQYEFARLMQAKPDLETIVRDRVLNKDTPTLAEPEK